jgi:hypothetical protein
MVGEEPGRCQVFVGYSYGLYPGPEYRQTFDRVSERTGVKFLFADTRLTNVHILDKITKMIHDADLSLFDISDWNPNVTLELGIAKESGRPWYILIDPSKSTGRIHEAPADLRGFDRIQYGSFEELERGLLKLVQQPASGVGRRATSAAPALYLKLFDQTVEIDSTDYEAISIDIPKRSRLSIFARELWGQPFDLYIFDRRNYAEFCRNRGGKEFHGVTDESVIEFERTVPRLGGWYIVLDAYNKRNNRRVALEAKYLPPVSTSD